jgi:hypothetical protein
MYVRCGDGRGRRPGDGARVGHRADAETDRPAGTAMTLTAAATAPREAADRGPGGTRGIPAWSSLAIGVVLAMGATG